MCVRKQKGIDKKGKKEEKKYGQGLNPNSYRGKGNDVTYSAIHQWVKKYKIPSDVCECCNEKKPVELANISGEYKKDTADFEWLCRKCHMHKDERAKLVLENLKQYRKICSRCQKKIEVGERYICLKIFDENEKIIEKNYWHFSCWRGYIDDFANEKMKVMQEKILGVLQGNPIFQNLMGMIGGTK